MSYVATLQSSQTESACIAASKCIKVTKIMSLLRDMKLMSRDRIFLSRDKSVGLTGVLLCRATLFECLRQNYLSLRQVLACDVTSPSVAFQIHSWDWRSIKQACSR